ncbi:hypothetical protein G647_08792 [Cladophialophora carrionii CBS 160.54]|uniref:L-ornithine N(5)-oxygenase n=1 Tax=Cladophialophora carrionii CBS 160.54 TaxID=1279043 RepID=V9CYQ9_9EURO|nr:uncharacterized protein G647_08792 [Cladophialophora carrionii CBS 160.54]ETI19779.1 hypothetical protein G647_08792 [Cladophialophora carrionii CBS 160.54]
MPVISERPYTADDIRDYPQCAPQPLKIIHVGAGASGLLFAHKAEKLLKNYELICYDKNDAIGGTWYENRYPGCACDIPAHTYTFPFEPNPEWSGYYSYSDEIQTYMLNFAKKYGVEKYIQLSTEVVAATWDETPSKWTVELKRRDGSTFTDTCDVLVNGTGTVNKWKWSAIDGLHDFQGTLAHSANWDRSIDWKGKTVAVIGTGSSSIQMVPKLQETAAHVTVFTRNQTYIATPFAQTHVHGEGEAEFRADPEYLLNYRREVERSIVSLFRVFLRGTEESAMAKKHLQEDMAKRLGDRDDLKKRFIPEWSPGCRRLTPGEGYLEARIQDNMTCVFDDIVKVTPQGILTADGTERKCDILACAMGFHVAFLPHFRITGLGGQVMQDQETPNVYSSVAAPGFPNYFAVNGPRGNWGQGCILPSHEVHIGYMLQCCKKMQEDGVRWGDAQAGRHHPDEPVHGCVAYQAQRLGRGLPVVTLTQDNKLNGRVYIWPGSLFHHMKYMKRPRFEHYEMQYCDPTNVFAFLGNGLTITEEKFGPKDLPVPYIRLNEDEEWDIE